MPVAKEDSFLPLIKNLFYILAYKLYLLSQKIIWRIAKNYFCYDKKSFGALQKIILATTKDADAVTKNL